MFFFLSCQLSIGKMCVCVCVCVQAHKGMPMCAYKNKCDFFSAKVLDLSTLVYTKTDLLGFQSTKTVPKTQPVITNMWQRYKFPFQKIRGKGDIWLRLKIYTLLPYFTSL